MTVVLSEAAADSSEQTSKARASHMEEERESELSCHS